MEEAFHLFEHRLNEISNILVSAFQVIRKESKSAISTSCLINATKPERSNKKTNLLEFLIDQPEEAYIIGFLKLMNRSFLNIFFFKTFFFSPFLLSVWFFSKLKSIFIFHFFPI
jgi:hypothetical protein